MSRPVHTLAARVLRTRLLLPGVLALALAACTSLTDATGDNRYGSITVRATGSGTGPFAATPTATFFTSFQQTLPNSVTTGDQCGNFVYAPETVTPGNLSAGGALQVQVNQSTVGTMTEPATVGGVYVLPAPNTFNYSPGDTLRVSVPGAAGGFPGGAVSVRLAEPIRLGALTPTNVNEDFPLSWQTNGTPTSGVIVSLRFGASPASVRSDRQVLCIVRDNGAYTIPGGLLGDFYASPPEFRELNVLRWRTNNATIDERSTLYIVSTIDTTVSLRN